MRPEAGGEPAPVSVAHHSRLRDVSFADDRPRRSHRMPGAPRLGCLLQTCCDRDICDIRECPMTRPVTRVVSAERKGPGESNSDEAAREG